VGTRPRKGRPSGLAGNCSLETSTGSLIYFGNTVQNGSFHEAPDIISPRNAGRGRRRPEPWPAGQPCFRHRDRGYGIGLRARNHPAFACQLDLLKPMLRQAGAGPTRTVLAYSGPAGTLFSSQSVNIELIGHHRPDSLRSHVPRPWRKKVRKLFNLKSTQDRAIRDTRPEVELSDRKYRDCRH
jgi:hypothetical protein